MSITDIEWLWSCLGVELGAIWNHLVLLGLVDLINRLVIGYGCCPMAVEGYSFSLTIQVSSISYEGTPSTTIPFRILDSNCSHMELDPLPNGLAC